MKLWTTRGSCREERLEPPYFIAEAGVNHEGSMEKALRMIDEVSCAGADAVKFQAYKAENLASKNSPAYWDTSKEKAKSQYELFRRLDNFKSKDFERLAEHAKSREIDFLATPFDFESVDFLESMVPAYKIASADITNKPLLEYVAGKRKPIILSTGASTVAEILRAVSWIRQKNGEELALMHCVLSYPTKIEDANLGMIQDMQCRFPGATIGYSDHTATDAPEDVLIAAWLLGARIIEKHYTWDRSLVGNDHYHSLDKRGLSDVVNGFRRTSVTVGLTEKRCLPIEEVPRKYARRSLVASRFIPKGREITEDDLSVKRPGTGIPPFMFDNIVGAKAARDIEEDEVLSLDLLHLNAN